jgi:GTP1/Obg family GTP-binding protein
MSLAERDKKIERLRCAAEKKRGEIIKRLTELREIKKQNEFMEGVYRDYERYRDNLVDQKRRSKEHMEMLLEYLERMKMTGSETNELLGRANYEQGRILEQINEVRKDLEHLTSA